MENKCIARLMQIGSVFIVLYNSIDKKIDLVMNFRITLVAECIHADTAEYIHADTGKRFQTLKHKTKQISGKRLHSLDPRRLRLYSSHRSDLSLKHQPQT